MLTAVLLASFFPETGKSGGWLHMENAVDIGVAIVVFSARSHDLAGQLQGRADALAQRCRRRADADVRAVSAAVLPVPCRVRRFHSPALMLGFLYLCVLPSTITSSVAMTSMAKGNDPGRHLQRHLVEPAGHSAELPCWSA